jgi:hypothetical protein
MCCLVQRGVNFATGGLYDYVWFTDIARHNRALTSLSIHNAKTHSRSSPSGYLFQSQHDRLKTKDNYG